MPRAYHPSTGPAACTPPTPTTAAATCFRPRRRRRPTTYTYDSRHQLLTVLDGNGHTVETNTYGTLGRVLSQTDALGKVTTFDYDFQGYEGPLTSSSIVIDPRGIRTQYYNDGNWQPDPARGVPELPHPPPARHLD
ncbi:MAG: hypothetical protein U0531_16340 [Dehalococcoidia bacterium]